ncbi:general secretion pathway protein F [Halopseudomonas litoralis]|uniref:General secretion pathway protein F n=1 Tax=Halopseudomonas litoralis TaxID=797277 RepID=A0A1H1QD34_9GAMM|nr:type II secretion system F family protein [Halopseudomonas litoralis]SDS21294.1 general secretion pathway protein F [Halopseudomonas litoralis]
MRIFNGESMARYRVDKLLPGGQVTRELLEAESEQALLRRAEEEGWNAIHIHPMGERFSLSFGSFGKPSLMLLSHELKTLLEAGLSLMEVLTALAERESHPAQRAVLEELQHRVRQGESLSDAMSHQPDSFPPLFVATIRSGERTGDLPRVIGRYLDYSGQLDELKRKLLSAITYPILLLVAGTAVVLFLLVYLVPRFSVIYEQVGTDLSLPARTLLQWGVWAKDNPFLLAAGLLAIPILTIAAWRNVAVRARITQSLISSRWVGRHWQSFNVSRYCRSLSLLAGGGIPLPEAMRLAGGLLPALLQERLHLAIERIQHGQRLSDALSGSQLMTPIALRLLRAGERSSDVPSMLEQAADFHDRELAHLFERLSKLIEPLLMLFIGLLIGGIVVMMYLPIFELAGSLRP